MYNIVFICFYTLFWNYNLIMFYPLNFYFDIIRTLFNVLKISEKT